MNDQEIIKAVAELDGFELLEEFHPVHTNYIQFKGKCIERKIVTSELPSYTTSRDAIIPVIEKQPYAVQVNIASELCNDTYQGVGWTNRDAVVLMTVPPPQLCQALLMVKGKWKMSDTPRTDAAEIIRDRINKDSVGFDRIVTTDFARQLECELAGANKCYEIEHSLRLADIQECKKLEQEISLAHQQLKVKTILLAEEIETANVFMGQVNKLQARVAELQSKFQHVHVNIQDGTDTCAKCGLDLRDEIHVRI